MGCLTKAEIANAKDAAKFERVDVPEWGADAYVNVRVMTGRERDLMESQFKDSTVGIRAWIAANCICDDDGKDLFTDADIPMLEKKSGAALSRVLKVAMRLNGLSEESVKEMEKNS